jgi:hypothetical protein
VEDWAQPAREAKASRTDTAIPPMPADGNYDCADFQTRALAVAVLERDLSDPHYLDSDEDGIPCEDLPPEEGYAADANSPSDSENGSTTGPAIAAGAPPPPSAERARSMLEQLAMTLVRESSWGDGCLFGRSQKKDSPSLTTAAHDKERGRSRFRSEPFLCKTLRQGGARRTLALAGEGSGQETPTR